MFNLFMLLLRAEGPTNRAHPEMIHLLGGLFDIELLWLVLAVACWLVYLAL